MGLCLATFLYSVASALIPLLNEEVYLGALGTRTSVSATLGLSVAAGAGQTVGKLVWYGAARWSMESRWVQRQLAKPKVRSSYDAWMERTRDRAWYAAAVVFLAASVGLPPLLVMAVIAGSLRMRIGVFALACLVGRTARFLAILAGVSWAFG